MTTVAPSTASCAARGSRRSCSEERTIVVSAPSSSRRRTSGRPRNPAPPVTTTGLPFQNCGLGSATADAYVSAGEPILECLHVGLDHDAHGLLERHGRRPAQLLARLGGVATQRVDLGRAVVLGIDLDD